MRRLTDPSELTSREDEDEDEDEMCLVLRRCFPRRENGCRGRCSGVKMRTRTESDGTEPAAGRGRRMKILKFLGINKGGGDTNQPNNITTTDGHSSPEEEEPKHVEAPSFEQNLERCCLSEASQLLIQRERRMFGVSGPSEALQSWSEEAELLSADFIRLRERILQQLLLSLSREQLEPAALASAVAAVGQQEEQDRLWEERGGSAAPPWRPCGWQELHDATLRQLVEEHMDNPAAPPAAAATAAAQLRQSSLQADIHAMGRQLKEDLLLVVQLVADCYPAERNICQFYAAAFHQTFGTRLRKIADFGLDDKDCCFLLRWVNQFYPELLAKPELSASIDAAALEKLLPPELLQPLEEQYLGSQQSELTTFIGRVLEEAKAVWNRGEEPKMEDGCYASPVAYDIIQLVNGRVTTAERVVSDLRKAQSITTKLTGLMQSFSSFQDDIIKRNTANSRPFIKANLGCIRQFRDFLVEQSRLFPRGVQERCLSILRSMKQSAHLFLLSPAHKSLKPNYRKLGTSDWLNQAAFERLLLAIEKEIGDLQGSCEFCHKELIGEFHQEVTVEYVRRLLKGELKLKGREQQQKASATVSDNAESLHALFSQQGSQHDWLKNVLIMIAGVLNLQELPAIQMQVASLGMTYPDLSEKHVSAMLKLKSNLSKSERTSVKQILLDALREAPAAAAADPTPFFSRVQVK